METRDRPPAAPGAHAAPGIEIPGFEIVRRIGSGGMGSVYEALDLKMRRRVALKVMSGHRSVEESAQVRFAREAWIGGKLSHPNLVKVLEMGSAGSMSFFSMELCDGGSLHDVVTRMRRHGRDEVWGLEMGTPEYVTWALRQIIAAAGALDYAHRNGVIHRDIKPMNLLLTRDPATLKIADFGLALEEKLTRITTTRAVLGTMAFMAPEQIRGGRVPVDGRTDIYALGVTLFELLTLHLPYRAESSEMYAHAVLHEAARRPSSLRRELSRDLDIVLGKALEKEPEDRYESAAGLAEDLENVVGFRPIRARPPGTATRLGKWIRRKPLHATLAALLAVGIPAGAWLSVRAVQRARLVTRMEIADLREEAKRLTLNNQPGAAAERLTKVLDLDPSNLRALRARSLNYRRVARGLADPEERDRTRGLALADATRLVGLEPGAAWTHQLRALLLAETGRHDEAARDEKEAARLRLSSPPTPDELEMDGNLAIERGDYASAVKDLTQVIDMAPDSADAYYNRAIARQKLGEIDKARMDLQVAVALQPRRFELRYELARVLALEGDFESSAAHYEEAHRIVPGSPLVPKGRSDLFFRRAERKAVAGDAEGALQDYVSAQEQAAEALRIEPGDPWAHLNLGVSLAGENGLRPSPDGSLMAKALDHYQRAISAWEAAGADPGDPEYQVALSNVCDALIEMRRLDEALEACRRVSDLFREVAAAAYNMAGVYALLGRREEALAELQRDFDLGDRDHEYLAADDWFESLREEPRFKALLAKMRE